MHSMDRSRRHAPAYRDWDIRVSFMNRLPYVHQRHQFFLPLYRYAFEAFDFNGYDYCFSITSAFAHGIRKPANAWHICYCLTPALFLWQYDEYVMHESVNGVARQVLPAMVAQCRSWDRRRAGQVDEFIAISREVQRRIEACYGRDSCIVYPPVDVTAFHIAPPAEIDDYFLIISRLIPYKQIQLAVDAFNETGQRLLIAGDGRDRARLQPQRQIQHPIPWTGV